MSTDQNINSMSIEELNKLKEQLTKVDPNNSFIETLNERIKSITDSNNIIENNKRFQLATEFMNQAQKVYDLILKSDYNNTNEDIDDLIKTRLNRFIEHIQKTNKCVSFNSKAGVQERYDYISELSKQWIKNQEEYESSNGLSFAPSDQYWRPSNPYDISFSTIYEGSQYIPKYNTESDSNIKHRIIFDWNTISNEVRIINYTKEPVQLVIDNIPNMPESMKRKLSKLIDSNTDTETKNRLYYSIIDEFKSLWKKVRNKEFDYNDWVNIDKDIIDLLIQFEKEIPKVRFYYYLGHEVSTRDFFKEIDI